MHRQVNPVIEQGAVEVRGTHLYTHRVKWCIADRYRLRYGWERFDGETGVHR